MKKKLAELDKHMSKPVLSDIFIGNFPVTQRFGENPVNYTQFGLKGHDGVDFGCPSSTQIVSATDGKVIKIQNDPSGYGWFVEIWDDIQNCATLYAHLRDDVYYNTNPQAIKVGDRVIKGQFFAYSDNTGNSTGSHLHFGFCLTDANGIKLNQDNGYAGWLNPDTEAVWDIKNLTAPIVPVSTPIPLQTAPQKPTVDLIGLVTELTKKGEESYGVIELDVLKSKLIAKDQYIADHPDSPQIKPQEATASSESSSPPQLSAWVKWISGVFHLPIYAKT